MIEIPSYNRLEGIAFSSVSFGRHLGVNGRGGIVSHVYADQRIVVWRGYDSAPFNQERVFKYSFYDAKSQRSISADSERALITAVDREFGMDIASLFPLPTLYEHIRRTKTHHLIVEPWEYESLISDFNKALVACFSDGVHETSGKINDFRGCPIYCELVEDGEAIRLVSSKPGGSERISLKIFLDHARNHRR